MKLSPNTAVRKELIIKSLLFALNVLVAGVIFWFSSQNAEKSGSLSDSLVYVIVKATTGHAGLSEKSIIDIVEMLTFYVRKFAHFSIYALFSVTMFSYVRRFKLKKIYIPSISFAVCALYAVSDEIHQYFVPGRSCEIRDVIIDSCGILTGLAIIYLIKKIKMKFKKV